jgi:antirestriction protein
VVLELVDDHDRPAFEAWLAYDQGRTTEVDADTVDTFRDAYQGTFRDVGDFAAELLSDQVEAALGEQLAYYFDYDQYGRDLLSQGWTALVAPACEEFGFAPVYVFRDE